MFISFFESVKHLGHYWPVALFRIYVGINFIHFSIDKIHRHYLDSPVLTEILSGWAELPGTSPSYHSFLHDWVIPHWQLFAYILTFGEMAIGISYVIGFLVRPASLAAMILLINIMLGQGPESYTIGEIYFAANAMIFMVSAGRCVGFDYYFYKRVRGIWW